MNMLQDLSGRRTGQRHAQPARNDCQHLRGALQILLRARNPCEAVFNLLPACLAQLLRSAILLNESAPESSSALTAIGARSCDLLHVVTERSRRWDPAR